MNRRHFLLGLGGVMSAPFAMSCGTAEPGGDRVLASAKDSRKVPPTVLRVHSPEATNWDYQTGTYVKAINLNVVHRMMTQGLCQLTGTNSLKAAWKVLLKGPKSTDRILVKANLNNSEIGYGQAIMTSPQVIACLVQSLVEGGIPNERIVLYDLTAIEMSEIAAAIAPFGIETVWLMPRDTLKNRIRAKLGWGSEFPNFQVQVPLRHKVIGERGEIVTCFMPKLMDSFEHLINLSVVKAHQFVLHSSALKNHFGTVRFSNQRPGPRDLHGPNIEDHIVDINAHPLIATKTRLLVGEGLFGAPMFTRGGAGRTPTKWKTFPGGPTPNSLFFATDPVALESVIGDYITEEQKYASEEPYSHEYLHIAEGRGLGVHEHRDESGRYRRIDYREAALGNTVQ